MLAPQFLYASPSSAAVVELFACAYAIISAKWVDCEASRLKVLILSVTIWDASARSILEAAANCRTPSIPERVWFTDHPARDIFVIALAASVAENFVLLPRLFALFSSASSSDPVAPEIASTSLIPASKELPTSTTYSAASFALSPIAEIASPASSRPFAAKASPKPSFKLSPNSFVVLITVVVSFPYSFILFAHLSVAFCASCRYFSFCFKAWLFFSISFSASLTFLDQSDTFPSHFWHSNPCFSTAF